ncbi:hypothetical protein [Rhodococcus sp. IEGM 1379]|uniref:hypothetical protein n=1 Tax=Rhodococcus sp. IEGM 1379 TaxID=3047086 RepID=UPI0024B6F0AC|nr:hypothetical protein [Rhodococcus sp. IEGM 1379]MDI9916075.1 hypothetical protein [Rhodococcus sp. IEGM 1379]
MVDERSSSEGDTNVTVCETNGGSTMEGIPTSYRPISSASLNRLSGNCIQSSGSGGLVERLNVLFRSAADSGAVLTHRQLTTALSSVDARRDSEDGIWTESVVVQRYCSARPVNIGLEFLADVDGCDDIELSDPWAMQFIRAAEGLSGESLELLFQACAHLMRSELSE